MRKRWRNVGSESRRKENIYILPYVDDIVAMEGEDKLRSIKRPKRYLDEKRLEVNTEKTKITKFRKGGKRLVKKK